MIEKIKLLFINNREVKNASWLISGKIIQMILSFLLSIFTTRYLGPTNFGTINYASAYVAFFTSFCTLGINSIIVKELIDYPNEQGEIIGTTLVLREISSLLSSLTIILIVSIIDYNDPTTIVVASLCSLSLLFQVFDTFNYWFQSKYESKISAIATLIAYLGISLYKLVLLLLKKDVKWFALSNSVDYLILGILLYLFYKRFNGPNLKFSFKRGKNLLEKSYHYILSGMMVAIYGQTDKFMLKHMLDKSAVGYYSLATSINLMWVFILQAIIDSICPTIMRLYSKDKELFKKKNRQLYAIVIYISIFVAVMFLIFGKIFITVVYGESYLPAYNSLRIVTLYTIFAYLGVARNSWIVCEKKQKYLKYMYLLAAFENVILNMWLIPKYGAEGAAIASLITQISTSVILPLCIKDMRPNVKLMYEALLLKNIK